MSKIKQNYEKSWWPKLQRWVNGESEDGTGAKDLELAAASEASVNKHRERIKQHKEDSLPTEARYEAYQKEFEKKGIARFNILYGISAVVICLVIISALLVTVSYLPEFGNASNPVNNEVSQRYIEKGLQETGAVNIVTGMILDYRAFDTFGESHVLFVAACCVLILLRIDVSEDKDKQDEKLLAEMNDRIYEPKNDMILQKIAFILVPSIIIFGIYVILFGHLSPGGGFSGGAIIGAALILHLNAFGFKKTETFFTKKTFQAISLGGLLTYAIAKSYSFFTGANHIHSIIPLGVPGHVISSGLILILNICVGLVVSCTMYAFYVLFRKGDF